VDGENGAMGSRPQAGGGGGGGEGTARHRIATRGLHVLWTRTSPSIGQELGAAGTMAEITPVTPNDATETGRRPTEGGVAKEGSC